MTTWEYNDGGRSKYFKGRAGDCVVRAIAIAANLDYGFVYEELESKNRTLALSSSRSRVANSLRKGASPRNGNFKEVYHPFIESLGFKWVPTMQIGSGCKVHLRADELPSGRIICRLSKHLVAVVDGVIQDTHDSSRGGTRCVYGYYQEV